MPKGGHANSGPAPDPNALRRTRGDDAGWHVLPITGRSGPLPEWPLEDQSGREVTLWARLWAKPQAVRWEVLGQVDEVALYVRRWVEAEKPGAAVAAVVVVRQLGDALGLTIPGMLRLRWQIGPAESRPTVAAPAGTAGAPALSRGSARDRLSVVPDVD